MIPSLEEIEIRRRRLLRLSYVVIFLLCATVVALLFFIDSLAGLFSAVRYNAPLRVYLIVFVLAFIYYLGHKERQQYLLTQQLMDDLRNTSGLLEKELKRDIFLNKTSQNFAAFPGEQALSSLLRLAGEHFQASGGSIVNRVSGGEWKEVFSCRDDEPFEVVAEIAEWVERTGHSLLVPSEEAAGLPRVLKDEKISTVVAAPLRLRGKLHGVLTLWRKESGEAFGQEDLRLLELAARQAAAAAYNHEEATRNQRTVIALSRILAETTDKLAPELGVSAVASGELVCSMADKLGLSADERDYVLAAAYLQKVGILTLPANFLDQSAYTDEEEELIEQRLCQGGEILRELGFPRGVSDLLPLSQSLVQNDCGLDRENVPLGAYLVAVAHAYLSMSPEYATSIQDPTEEIREQMGQGLPEDVLGALRWAVQQLPTEGSYSSRVS